MDRRRRESRVMADVAVSFRVAAVPVGLSLIVGLTALALGGGRLWASSLFELALVALAWVWFRSAFRPTGMSPSFRRVAALAAFLGIFIALQTVPLPGSVLERLSPAAAEIHRAAASAVEAVPARPPTGEAHQPVTAAWSSLTLHPFVTRTELLRYATLFLAFWMAATSIRPTLLLRGLVGVGAAIALLALAQDATWNGHILWLFEPYEGETSTNRMLGTFINPNLLAAFLAMLLPVAAGWLVHEIRRPAGMAAGRIVCLALVITLMAAALIGTASRGALLGLAIGPALALAVLLFLDRRILHSIRGMAGTFVSIRGVVAASGVGLLVLSGCLLAGPDARSVLVERFHQVLQEPDAGAGSRVDHWKQTVPIAADFPLFGVGAGGWAEIFRQYERYPLSGLLPNHVHNDYLEWLTEVGWIGVLLTTLLVVATGHWLLRNDRVPTATRWGLLAGISAVLLHELVDFPLRTPANALLLASLGGLAGNPHWRPASRPVANGRRPDHRMTLAVTAALGLLGAAGLWQFLEFVQWSRAVAGSTETVLPARYAPTWMAIGTTLREQGDRQGATAAFRTAARLRPADPYAYWGITLATTDPEQGRQSLDTAIRLHPTRAIWRATRAVWLAGHGRSDAALREIETAAYLDPRPDHHPYLLAGKGGALSPAVTAAALHGFRRAAAEHPEDAPLQIAIANVHDRLGAPAEAAKLRARAARLRPGDDEHQFEVGRAFFEAGEYESAVVAFQRCAEANPDHASYHYHLGKSLQQLDNPEGALVAYHRAAALKSGKELYRRKVGEMERLLRNDGTTRPEEPLLP